MKKLLMTNWVKNIDDKKRKQGQNWKKTWFFSFLALYFLKIFSKFRFSLYFARSLISDARKKTTAIELFYWTHPNRVTINSIFCQSEWIYVSMSLFLHVWLIFECLIIRLENYNVPVSSPYYLFMAEKVKCWTDYGG